MSYSFKSLIKIVTKIAYKGTLSTVNLPFESDTCHLVEPSGASKSIEGFVPIDLSSRVMALLLTLALLDSLSR